MDPALAQFSIKSVVLVSSIAAIISSSAEPPYHFTEADWNHTAIELTHKLGKETSGPIIYVASNAASEKAFWEFRDEKKPSFTMTVLNPTRA